MKYVLAAVLILTTIGMSDASGQGKDKRSRMGKQAAAVKNTSPLEKHTPPPAIQPHITFYELGSVNCIPCKQMQPIMKSIWERYRGQVAVIFYDVWKKEQKSFAAKFGIKLIPTQVFVNRDGKELMRHEGFFPEKDIDTFLQAQGIKPTFPEKGS